MAKPLSRMARARMAGLAALAAALLTLALPLSTALAYVFTTATNGTGGNPSQTIYSEKIQSDGSSGPTGSGPPKSFTVNWSASVTGGTISANATFTVTTFTTSHLTFSVSVDNTSTLSGARLTILGFGLNPSITDTMHFGVTSSVYSSAASNFPNISAVTFCATAGSNCSGGSGGGLNPGGMTTFTLDLFPTAGFGSATNLAATITAFGAKFQSPNASFELPGMPTRPAPEPASLSLLAAALFGIVALRPRRATRMRGTA